MQQEVFFNKISFDEYEFVCPPIPPIASDRLRRHGLFAQISLIAA